MEPSGPVNPALVFSLRLVTERAACAAFNWIGRGEGTEGARAGLDAMRSALSEIDIDAVVVIGEATKSEGSQPQRGERLGRPVSSFKADIALDPVEGTSYLVRGLTNALAVLAVAPRGAMMNPGPAFYMEKFVASPPARGRIDPHWPPAKKLAILAEALNKDISDLTVFVLEKPRHRELVNAIIEAGARVALYPGRRRRRGADGRHPWLRHRCLDGNRRYTRRRYVGMRHQGDWRRVPGAPRPSAANRGEGGQGGGDRYLEMVRSRRDHRL